MIALNESKLIKSNNKYVNNGTFNTLAMSKRIIITKIILTNRISNSL